MQDKSAGKRIAKNTALLYLRQLFTLFLALYTSRLTLRVLGVTDFGIYAAVGGVTAFLSILTSSLSSSCQRFLTYSLAQEDTVKLNKIYNSSINIHIALSLLLLLLAETVGLWFLYNKMTIPTDRLGVAVWVYQFSILGAVMTIINAPNHAELIAHEDMGVIAFIYIADAVLKLFGVIALNYIEWDKLFVYAAILFAINGLNPLASFIYCRIKYCECRLKFFWDRFLTKSMLALAGWNALTGLSIMGFIQGTNILLNVVFGPIVNSAYAVASQAYSGIRSFTSSFQLASNPQIVKLYSKHELIEMHELLMRVCKYSLYLIFVISFPFVLNAKVVLTIWLKNVPPHSEAFFILLLLFSYIDVLAYPLDIAAQSTGKLKKYSLCVSCCIITILPVSYVFFKLGSIPETILVVAFVVACLGITIRLVLLTSLIKLPINKFIKNVLSISLMSILIICLATVPIRFFLNDSSIVQSIIYFSYIIIVECIVLYYIGLNKSERIILINMKNRILSKL